MNWTPEQYNELAERYRDMSDADLRRLASVPEDLTEIAEEVLKKELNRRGLTLTAASEEIEAADKFPEDPEPFTDEEISREVWQLYIPKAPDECTFPFATEDDARHACLWLAESGIQYGYAPLNSNDRLGPRIVVRPNDAERTAALLAQPIPEHILNAPEDEDPGAFVAPVCPNCHAPDSVLIALDPTNRWLCEECEHEWDDPAEPEHS